MTDTTITFVTPATVARNVERRNSGVRFTSQSEGYRPAPRTMGQAVPEVHVQQRVIAADLRADMPARNIRRPQVAKRQPRLSAPAFDPALVSRTLSPRG